MAKDQQGLDARRRARVGRGVRSRDRRLLRADRRSGRRSQICARARSRFRAGRRRDRGALYDRRLSRRPSGGCRARSARPKRRSGGASERERRHLAAAKAWAQGETSQAILGWETILADHPTDALALRLAQDAYFFLGRSAAIRDCAARVAAGLGSRQSARELRPRALRLRARGDRRPQARRGLRPRGARPQSARRLGDACAGPCHGDREPPRGGRGLSQVDPGGLGACPFHGPPQRLASRAVSDRAGSVRRGSRRLRPLHGAQARRRRDARPHRRRFASVAARTCGGRRRRPLGARRRHMDGACRRPCARLQRSALRLRRRALARPGPRHAPQPLARRL